MVVLPGAVGPQQAEHLASRDGEVDPSKGRLGAIGLAQPGDLDRGDAARHRSHHGNIAGARMLCGCIDIGTNTTRVLVAERARRAPPRGPPAPRVHPPGPRTGGRAARSRRPGSPRPPSVVAEQHALAEQAGARTIRAVATAVIRQRGPTATSSARRSASTAASRSACSTARRRRGWPSWAPRARSAAPLHGRVAVVDVGGGSTEIAVGTLAGRRRVVARPSRSARAFSPTPIWAATRRRASELDAVRCARLAGAGRPRRRAGRRRGRGRRQRGLAAAARRRRARPCEPRARAASR